MALSEDSVNLRYPFPTYCLVCSSLISSQLNLRMTRFMEALSPPMEFTNVPSKSKNAALIIAKSILIMLLQCIWATAQCYAATWNKNIGNVAAITRSQLPHMHCIYLVEIYNKSKN